MTQAVAQRRRGSSGTERRKRSGRRRCSWRLQSRRAVLPPWPCSLPLPPSRSRRPLNRRESPALETGCHPSGLSLASPLTPAGSLPVSPRSLNRRENRRPPAGPAGWSRCLLQPEASLTYSLPSPSPWLTLTLAQPDRWLRSVVWRVETAIWFFSPLADHSRLSVESSIKTHCVCPMVTENHVDNYMYRGKLAGGTCCPLRS